MILNHIPFKKREGEEGEEGEEGKGEFELEEEMLCFSKDLLETMAMLITVIFVLFSVLFFLCVWIYVCMICVCLRVVIFTNCYLFFFYHFFSDFLSIQFIYTFINNRKFLLWWKTK